MLSCHDEPLSTQPVIRSVNPIIPGLFLHLAIGHGLLEPPSITSKPLVVQPPNELITFPWPPSKHNLIDTIT